MCCSQALQAVAQLLPHLPDAAVALLEEDLGHLVQSGVVVLAGGLICAALAVGTWGRFDLSVKNPQPHSCLSPARHSGVWCG